MKKTVLLSWLFLTLLNGQEFSLRILDRDGSTPVAGAKTLLDDTLYKSDARGFLLIDTNETNATLTIKAAGYRSITTDLYKETTLLLEPQQLKALYISFWAAGDRRLMQRILKLAEKTEINAVVVDIKNEYGYMLYPNGIETAREIGAYDKVRIKDIKTFIQKLKARGLYVIGRLVVFKDDRLATERPELAIKRRDGNVWKNSEGIAWSDPYREAVRHYNIEVAADAASKGFDEINFDYVRLPSVPGLRYAKPNHQANRVMAVTTFLQEAQTALDRYNVFSSVDTYGYVCWNENDTGIGHQLDKLAGVSDYIAPMLYPSSYHLGIPGYEESLKYIYQMVRDTLEEGYRRFRIDRRRFRPWLQAFPDYAFDKRSFGEFEIREQIDGAEDFNASGWMLWHPGSYFSSRGLKLKQNGNL